MISIGRLRKLRFSLRAFLLTLLVLSLFGSNAYVSWKWDEARQEIDFVREELGYLTIADPTQFYIREVPTLEPLSWRWRIYAPPGERSFHLGIGRVPAVGLQADTGAARGPSSPRDSLVGEYTMTARIERDQLGKWRLAVSWPEGGLWTSILGPDASWLSAGDRYQDVHASRKCDIEVAGSKPVNGSATKRQTESFSPDEPVVLLRLRAPQDLKRDAGEPCDGVLIWFENAGQSGR